MDDQLQMALSPQQPLGGQRVRRITGLWKRKRKKTTGQTYKQRLKNNILKFGAINVGTLRGKEEEMVELMKLRQVSVLGLSETRMKGCGDRIIHGGYRLIYIGEDSGRHGVAFLVSSDVAQCVEKVIFKNDRIISIDFKLRTAISIIQAHAPKQGRPLKEKEEFYELLQTTMSEVMYQDSTILCRDWNGHIGCDRKQYETVLGIHSIGNRNEEGTSYAIKDKSSNLLTEPEEIAKRLGEYFMELLNIRDDEGASQELEENEILAEDDGNDSITVEEVRQVMKQMKNGKAPVDDGITFELLGAGGECIVQQLLKMFNITYRSESVPLDWQRGVTCPLFKKGDKTSCDNYRGIPLLSHTGKLYNRIIERRL